MIALMTAGNKIVSIIGGLAVFADPLGDRPAIVLVHLAAFVLIVVAAWRLGPMQAAGTAPAGARPELGSRTDSREPSHRSGLARLGRPGPA